MICFSITENWMIYLFGVFSGGMVILILQNIRDSMRNASRVAGAGGP